MKNPTHITPAGTKVFVHGVSWTNPRFSIIENEIGFSERFLTEELTPYNPTSELKENDIVYIWNSEADPYSVYFVSVDGDSVRYKATLAGDVFETDKWSLTT